MGVKCDKDCFIAKAVEVHGYRYDYSLVDYKNNKIKVKIICEYHGIFEQAPVDHTSHKSGCNRCGVELQKCKIRLTQEQAIDKFKFVYNDKYDYSKFIYIDTFNKSTVICKTHGEFLISASSHLSGIECKVCKNIEMKRSRTYENLFKITEDVFLDRAIKKHGDKYNYNKVVYESYTKPVIITCVKHKVDLEQTPRNHLANSGGCHKCKAEIISSLFLKSPKNFIFDAILVHNGYYSYSKTEYVNSKIKVIITCPIHGDFEQAPSDHLGAHGCRKCGQKGSTYNITKANRNKEEFSKIQTTLYLIEFKSENENYIKLGISNEKNLRHSVLERVSKCKIVDSLNINVDLYTAIIIEQTILKETKECAYVPLYNYPGYTECFEVECKEIVENKINILLKNNLHN